MIFIIIFIMGEILILSLPWIFQRMGMGKVKFSTKGFMALTKITLSWGLAVVGLKIICRSWILLTFFGLGVAAITGILTKAPWAQEVIDKAIHRGIPDKKIVVGVATLIGSYIWLIFLAIIGSLVIG